MLGHSSETNRIEEERRIGAGKGREGERATTTYTYHTVCTIVASKVPE
tara:strand:+ start:242 stop:385 length:144 start_codon:yes stop_codon:yes gene_type:complete